MVGLATCGGASGAEAGSGWKGGEREGEKNYRNGDRGAGFWPTLDPIFSSLRSSTKPLFIGGRRG